MLRALDAMWAFDPEQQYQTRCGHFDPGAAVPGDWTLYDIGADIF